METPLIRSDRPSAPQKYTLEKCANEACPVMIGVAVGAPHGLTICTWCQGGVASWQRGG